MRLIAVIEDAAAVIERILKHLGLWQRGPPPARQVVIESRDRDTPDVNY